MGINAKRILTVVLLVLITASLSGCRSRIIRSAQETGSQVLTYAPDETNRSGNDPNERQNDEPDGVNPEEDEADAWNGRTKENPEAKKKEYDDQAQGEIVEGANHLIHQEGEGNGTPMEDEHAENAVILVQDAAEETALQTVASGNAEKRGVADDAEEAESAMTYFTVLLEDTMGSVFECQRDQVYWETPEDYVTIHKSSQEHDMILNAGAYDVSARLLPENLHVDAGWVLRKNPQVIVKIVEKDILGSGVQNTRAAQAVAKTLETRDGWSAIDAVKNRKILILSREMLETPRLQTAAMLVIAKTSKPDLFSDLDLQQALEMLTEEATGSLLTGILYYSDAED